ncbi:MAG TPA: hypothetical protein VGK33_04430 [Chloroflexota bacterium]
MSSYTFDVKAFVTVHVTADDEATARLVVDDMLPGLLEGGSWHGHEGQTITINSVGLDGDHDLLEDDDEPA